MKNIRNPKGNGLKARVFTFVFVASCLLVLSGCRNPVQPPEISETVAGTGMLSLAIGRQSVGRTIMPEITLDDFVVFNLMFVARQNSGNMSFNRSWTRDGIAGGPDTVTGTIELNAGIWDLYVTAYLPDGEAARGSLRGIEIPSGETVAGNVRLFLVDEGIFSWDINFPANVVSARMEITRIYWAGTPFSRTFYFVGGTPLTDRNSSFALPEGRYRVVFRLANNDNERAVISSVLRVYRNMESSFAHTFEGRHFILYNVLSAWDGSRWDFEGNGITAGHFDLLDINGVDDGYGEFVDGIVDWFDALSYEFGEPIDLEGLKALVDTALLGIASEDADFLASINYREAQRAIAELVENDSPITFRWTDGRTLTVNTGVYEVAIVFDWGLAAQLASLRIHARSGNTYTIELGGHESISPAEAALPANRTDLTIMLRGRVQSEIRLSGNGVLFTIRRGNTLILCENITLLGRLENNSELVLVGYGGGTLIMNAGARVSGNGQGVRVFDGSTFTMHGGEISGNSGGSGVTVLHGSTFTMHGGEISRNRNSSGGGGGGVNVGHGSTFTMYGGEISRNFTSSGGGVFVGESSTFTMHGGEISGNNTSSSGGGVIVWGNRYSSTFTMYGGEIFGNTAAVNGGVSVSFWRATFTMHGGEIFGNTANNDGGGVGISNNGTFRMSNGVIYGNELQHEARRNVANNRGFSALMDTSGLAERINNAGSVVGTLNSTNNTIRIVNGQFVP